ncbi:NUDIX hydrolase [Planococcus shenhongbingii]|uniref:NUDIX hydrolase n=1 Tax=Planococcus shenhongbingii TaxID=3058398 RepID=A0ABT8NFK5_9BACL|nr:MULTISPECIES: NUDIX hydrolase [unclassified Planococcus (in: firmicutes)]MDN7246684.1 NUDIX hydrolase [Planococcus sp. N017]WKA58956.1 NUDIX hydrolase [Planococcus sp. N016]
MEMSEWKGAAGVCINEKNEVLLVLQGPPGEEKKWTVPAGGIEQGESLRECIEREFYEETGLTVKVTDELKVRSGEYENAAVSFDVHYFKVEVTGGEITLQEGDEWISDVAWKSLGELAKLDMAYPDDAKLIESLIQH